jgi:uncharacterized protein (TIGR02453 family)
MYSASTLSFLTELKNNNNREWFEKNRDRYAAAREDHLKNTAGIITKIATWDEGMKDVEAKKCVFRIYRDVRFSKDKSPYKTNMGAYFSPDRKDWARAGYYLHIEPGASFMAGGVYSPGGEHLRRIRQEIDYNLTEFESILQAKAFQKYWGNEFGGERLKKAPKDYPADHPGIEYLKQKDFIFSRKIQDKELIKEGMENILAEGWKLLYPLHLFLDRVWE